MRYFLLILFVSCFISVIKTEEIVDNIESRTFIETIYMKLDDKIKDLTIQLAISQEQTKHLEKQVNGLSSKIDQQSTMICQQKSMIDQQSLKIEKFNSMIDQQKSMIDQQGSIIDQLKIELHATKEDVKLLKIQQNELKSKININSIKKIKFNLEFKFRWE